MNLDAYPKVPDRRNHTTLVDEQYDNKLSQITRPMWEPVSELQAEHDLLEKFLLDPNNGPPMSEGQLREYRAKLDFWQAWLDNLFVNGNSVEGWKNNSMEKVLTHATEETPKNPAGTVAVANGKAEGVRRGLWD